MNEERAERLHAHKNDFLSVKVALESEGPNSGDQQAIAAAGVAMLAHLLRKNRDYGSSVYKPPRLAPLIREDAAILVRMSDKIERLESLACRQPEVGDESWEDTLVDLAGYIIIYAARKYRG